MTVYDNGSPFELSFPPLAPPLAPPIVRPAYQAKPGHARLFTAFGDYRYGAPGVYVTPRGHWWRSDDEPDELHNDAVCRGCGHHGHFDYILDYQRCTSPATAQDIVNALLRGTLVAA